MQHVRIVVGSWTLHALNPSQVHSIHFSCTVGMVQNVVFRDQRHGPLARAEP